TVDQLQSLGINDGLRPENLSLADYVLIADLLVDQKASDAGSEEVSND
ncbi:MAG: 16S rRNA (adenine(1518)-N(6)/adenine(1519)-N(6))-dimethyltransferase, partial [Marinobacter alexandrii]